MIFTNYIDQSLIEFCQLSQIASFIGLEPKLSLHCYSSNSCGTFYRLCDTTTAADNDEITVATIATTAAAVITATTSTATTITSATITITNITTAAAAADLKLLLNY